MKKKKIIKLVIIVILLIIGMVFFYKLFISKTKTNDDEVVKDMKEYLYEKYPDEVFENFKFKEIDDYYGNFTCDSSSMGNVGEKKGIYYLYNVYAKNIDSVCYVQKIEYTEEYAKEYNNNQKIEYKDDYYELKIKTQLGNEIEKIVKNSLSKYTVKLIKDQQNEYRCEKKLRR